MIRENTMTRTRRLSAATALALLGALGGVGTASAVAPKMTTEQAATSTGNQTEQQKEITGTVEKVDTEAGRVVVDGQTLFMPQSSEAPSPKLGDKVTFTYQEQGGKKVITSFRQGAKQ